MTMPKISIITPSYNQANFLESTIHSVKKQNYDNYEHIIIDGGSTDGSVEIIEKYESYLTYWESVRDKGQSDAINKGISKSSGDLICWLNSDDLLFDGALEKIAIAFNQFNDASLIYGSGVKTDHTGKIIIKKIEAQKYSRDKLRKRLYFLQPSMVFKRKIFEKIGGLNINSHYGMDWELALKISKIGKIYHIPHYIGKLRRHENAKTNVGKWIVAKELARISRECVGTFNINNVAYQAKNIIAINSKNEIPDWLKVKFDALFNIWAGENGYLMKLWPSNEEIRLLKKNQL